MYCLATGHIVHGFAQFAVVQEWPANGMAGNIARRYSNNSDSHAKTGNRLAIACY